MLSQLFSLAAAVVMITAIVYLLISVVNWAFF